MDRFRRQIREGFDTLDRIEDEKLYAPVGDRWEENPDGIPGVEARKLIEEDLERAMNEWERAA